ncbi:PilZ domain-containing protein [Methylobacterium crusticola]|uniref:PilZ domain-containing protein n=1 Tax=Methylobacterium crusticola TaxID=1697972 RepID=UPI000FFB2D09|nr:PilZ domain-containing protein [Methylobacterium crusticola]
MHGERGPASDTSPAPLRINGRYLLPGGAEHACQARSLSPEAAEVLAPVSGRPGDTVTVYLDDVGALTGVIRAVTPRGFSMTVEVGRERRARIAARLEWLAGRDGGPADQRDNLRIVPTATAVTVRLPDGAAVPGTILDLSMNGAAVAVVARPSVGSTVTVGKRFATVVRHIDEGIAVTFRLPFRPETFGQHVVL